MKHRDSTCDRRWSWCSARRAVLLAVVAAVVSVSLPAVAGGASRIPPPRPPQNPYLAENPNSNIHDDTWMTDAYRRGGPRGSNLQTALGPLPASVCGSLTFDRQGRITTVCPSLGQGPRLRLIDPKSLAVLAEYELPRAPTPAGTPEFQNFTGGRYFFLDQRDRVWSATKTQPPVRPQGGSRRQELQKAR